MVIAPHRARTWLIGPGRFLSLDVPRLIGVLNVTPDSFSDGGAWTEQAQAVDHALRMIDEGAHMIDVGGESTRPGAPPVPEREQIERTCGVIEALRGRSTVPISIDTTRRAVAEAALRAGAVGEDVEPPSAVGPQEEPGDLPGAGAGLEADFAGVVAVHAGDDSDFPRAMAGAGAGRGPVC